MDPAASGTELNGVLQTIHQGLTDAKGVSYEDAIAVNIGDNSDLPFLHSLFALLTHFLNQITRIDVCGLFQALAVFQGD